MLMFIIAMDRDGSHDCKYKTGCSLWTAGDSRRQASIIDCQQLANYEKSYLADQREYTGYAIKKYTPLSKNMTGDDGKTSLVSYLQGDMAGDFQISQYQDWYLFVILMSSLWQLN